jgi:hypothetical protein
LIATIYLLFRGQDTNIQTLLKPTVCLLLMRHALAALRSVGRGTGHILIRPFGDKKNTKQAVAEWWPKESGHTNVGIVGIQVRAS